ncbi:MAG TPA: YhjD/YihY/BrkB family envelope integrity protein [Acidimicrobiales bacterium]|nr:YhjD/YihY/BrkB family envelope integrity protein [Acidimicrobiales bacterium]
MSGEPTNDQVEPDDAVSRLRVLGEDLTGRATSLFDDFRARVTVVDTGMQVYERDREAAGTLLGSALALRLFLFFVPLVLLMVGLAGLLGRHGGVDSVADHASIAGGLADEIDGAFEQQVLTPWFAVLTGLAGIVTTGRSLTRALVLSSALSWHMGGHHKTPIRVIGLVVGLVVGIASASVILNVIRDAAGVAVAGFSFVVVALLYAALWSLLFLALPRRTPDPSAALPGAFLVALVLAGLQAITQFYLPDRISGASSIYGGFGVAVVVFGWFFIVGRTLALAFALNAVIYEQLGSVSRFVFGLPGVREIPRRVPAVGRFFDLEAHGREPTEHAADH